MSRLKSVLASTGRRSQVPGVWGMGQTPGGQGTTAAVVTQNQAELNRVELSAPVFIDTIRVFNGATVAGTHDVGVYRFDGTNYVRLASSGSVAQAGTSAIQSTPLTAGVWVQDGDYLAFASDSATSTYRQILQLAAALTGTPVNVMLLKASSFPLPATISSPAAGSRSVFMLGTDA